MQLIRTKLYRPPVTGHMVPRPRLHQHLEERLERPLTLVSAPAGYGKTTLVSDWLATSDLPHAWLSLDEYDNDLHLFVAYMLAAIRTIFPDAAGETHELLSAATLPPEQVLARGLANELDQIPSPFILVLDDYHVIQEQRIHKLLDELLRHPPRTMHLVITARRDPFLSVTRLRATSRMSEVRLDELRFTAAETGAYLQLVLGEAVEETAVADLTEKTEGWITGLRLVLLSLRHDGDLGRLLAELPQQSHYVTEYLVSEILSNQPAATREFLVKTSILDRMNSALCDAVLLGEDEKRHLSVEEAPSAGEAVPHGDASSAGTAAGEVDEPGRTGRAYLESLHQANLFTVPLDGQREWYRYHHQLQELLQQQLERQYRPTEIAALHARASTWYAQNGYIQEALRHALAAGDTAAATELVARHRHSLLNQERWHYLNRWLRLFPRQLVEEEPELLVAQAWVLYNRSQYPDMVAVLDRAETLLAGNASKTVAAKQHQAEIDAMRCEYILIYEGDGEQAVALARRALSEIPHDWFNVRGLAYVILGYGYLMLGEPEQGLEIIYDVLMADKTGSSMFRSRLLTALCFLHLSNADLRELGQAATQLLKLGQTDNLLESAAYARYFLGCYHYLRNELVEAERHLAAAAGDRKIAQTWSTINSACVLALTYQSMDRPDQARGTARATSTFLAEMENVEFVPQVLALQAELALRQEHPDEASRWARRFDPYPLPPLVTFCIPQLTLVRVLLAQDTTTSRKQATDLLAKLYEHVLNDKRYMIEVLALQALLDETQGDQVRALEKLERAIHLADPGGFIRLFVDLGPKMAGLLRQLQGQGIAPHYIDQILDAFGTEGQSPGRAIGSSQTSGRRGQPSASGGLVEPLTNRELDVLTLMAQGMTNKEIAAQLVISSGTVTQHSHRIYRKLMVKNRRLAVVEATKLGILPRD